MLLTEKEILFLQKCETYYEFDESIGETREYNMPIENLRFNRLLLKAREAGRERIEAALILLHIAENKAKILHELAYCYFEIVAVTCARSSELYYQNICIDYCYKWIDILPELAKEGTEIWEYTHRYKWSAGYPYKWLAFIYGNQGKLENAINMYEMAAVTSTERYKTKEFEKSLLKLNEKLTEYGTGDNYRKQMASKEKEKIAKARARLYKQIEELSKTMWTTKDKKEIRELTAKTQEIQDKLLKLDEKEMNTINNYET